MTTTTTTTRRTARSSRALAWVALTLAPVVLALVAGRRGVVVLGDALGEALARAAAPSRRHVRALEGAAGADELTEPRASLTRPKVRPASPAGGLPRPPSAPAVTGVYVPGSVVLAYARRGRVPAYDGPEGVTLRGAPAGLRDGDVVVRVGRAPVRSLREVEGIVTSAVLAGRTTISGAIRRGGDELPVVVEIPTGAPEAPPN